MAGRSIIILISSYFPSQEREQGLLDAIFQRVSYVLNARIPPKLGSNGWEIIESSDPIADCANIHFYTIMYYTK